MKKKLFLLCIVLLLIVFLVPIMWYNMPYPIRLHYYLKHYEGVRNNFIEDTQFDINQKDFSCTFDFNDKYVIPFVIEWHVTGYTDEIPKDFFSAGYRAYKLKINAELIAGDKTLMSEETWQDVPISFIPRQDLQYFVLLRCSYPLSCKFRDDVKLRVTVIETDLRLKGLRGKLVVKPELTL